MFNIGSFVCSLMRDKDDALARAHSNLAEVDTLQDKIASYRENIQVFVCVCVRACVCDFIHMCIFVIVVCM